MFSPQTTDLSGSIHQLWHGIHHRLQYEHLHHHGPFHWLQENTCSTIISSMGCRGVSALMLESASSPSSPFSAHDVCKISQTFFPLTPLCLCSAFALSYVITEMSLSWLMGSAVSCSGYIVESPETDTADPEHLPQMTPLQPLSNTLTPTPNKHC